MTRVIISGLMLTLVVPWCGKGQETGTALVDICDLARHPEEYSGKIVRVRADVNSGWRRQGQLITEFSIGQLFGSTRCIAHLKVILPARVKPEPGFALRQDEEFRKLDEALHTSKVTTATFQGRFVSGSKKDSGKAQPSAMKLILERVADVKAHSAPSR
jgi:hypothetical protein